ncbi:hypothetical protein [Dactylosporangium sp. NPDC005555]|uniref:hypothetical protein n=1 Tax=Dactylosporangium sp. NPDC005555 TaxID=3154889 RepID=UPI0033AC67A8
MPAGREAVTAGAVVTLVTRLTSVVFVAAGAAEASVGGVAAGLFAGTFAVLRAGCGKGGFVAVAAAGGFSATSTEVFAGVFAGVVAA